MKTINIESTATTPEVHLLEDGMITFAGKSMMENAIDFYGPIHDWVDKFMAKGLDKLEMEFDFVYFNSTSAKQILKMLMKLDESEINCVVNWKYPKDHDILKFRGAELESMLNMDFNYVAS